MNNTVFRYKVSLRHSNLYVSLNNVPTVEIYICLDPKKNEAIHLPRRIRI
jgi:hypothetical protein